MACRAAATVGSERRSVSAASAFDFTQIDELTESRTPNASSIPIGELEFGALATKCK